ncbi:hypothetical protein NZ35_12900 [Pseudomonas chlororaphis]|uniref:Uncharacterized protein n=1 Tax=Pseudomonas chlororaphis TaxID=587753 RepID=A0A0A6DAQ0_9PSED|nr:hypothetical protein NZ35_12900 [Pseudomonas chlororaphis]
MAGSVIDITFIVIRPVLALHQRHSSQLIAHIPAHGLSALQLQLIASAIKSLRNLRFSRQRAIVALGQTSIAASRGKHRKNRRTAVVTVEQIARRIVIKCLGVIAPLIRVQRCGQQIR